MSYQDALLYLRPDAVPNEDYFAHETGFTWIGPGTPPTHAEVDAAMLPAAKTRRIAAINAECRARLLARYGTAEEQVSRSLGIYGTAEKSAMELGIAATIDASNTASNAVIAAADTAAVEAVTVTWPVI